MDDLPAICAHCLTRAVLRVENEIYACFACSRTGIAVYPGAVKLDKIFRGEPQHEPRHQKVKYK